MMGGKLLWTGLTVIMTTAITHVPAADIVGEVLMVLGCILMWLDK